MDNANWNDDLDLFIVTKRGRIWTTRLLCILIAEILRVRRQRREAHTQDKVCLNLFMDGSQMKVPTFKQSQYTAHEVLQMKPLVSKNSTYELFLKENSWVFTIFPNAQKELRFNKEVRAKSQRHSSTKPVKRSVIAISSEKIGDMIELCCRMIQLSLIRRHQTTEIITDTQLWFFPDDYEKKLTPID
jgi:hypothetical protein